MSGHYLKEESVFSRKEKFNIRGHPFSGDMSDSTGTQRLAAPLAAQGTDSAAHEARTISTEKERNGQGRGEHPLLAQTLCSNVYSPTWFI